MKIIIAGLGLWLGAQSASMAGPMKDSSFQSISNYFARIWSRLAPREVTWDHGRSLSEKDLEEEYDSDGGKIVSTCFEIAPLFIVVARDKAEVFVVSNHWLKEAIKTNAVQSVPALTVPEALHKAKQYLVALELDVPSNCVVQEVTFNKNEKSCWQIRWIPQIGSYTHDESQVHLYQGMKVTFHEKFGFCSYGRTRFFPPPRTTVVNITKEGAIVTASKVAPLVMQTPYYRSARMSGFKVTGVESAELRISVPNWLLDPKRAVWIREKPPEETRLCWVVRFKTTDTVDRGEMKLTEVDILIYIDAATGEVVGADFT